MIYVLYKCNINFTHVSKYQHQCTKLVECVIFNLTFTFVKINLTIVKIMVHMYLYMVITIEEYNLQL